MKERQTRKEVFYDEEIGWAELYKHPAYPDRAWLRAGYYLDLTKTKNFRRTLDVVYDTFLALKESGITEIYCHVDSASAFRFNQRLGFETTNECFPNLGIEFMKREL